MADDDLGLKLITVQQAALVVRLMLEIGLAPGSEGMMLAQLKVGGTATPFGYLLLTRDQGATLITMMTEFLGLKRAGQDVITSPVA